MRHYEVVVMVHPDQSDQVPAMTERYRSMVEVGGGQVHRLEDWGRRQLAFPVAEVHKAHYILINFECEPATLAEMESAFQFNDAVIRHLVVRKDRAVTAPSPQFKAPEEERRSEGRGEGRSEGRGRSADDGNDGSDGNDGNDSSDDASENAADAATEK
jgi:SSU ribosomal protein S6P